MDLWEPAVACGDASTKKEGQGRWLFKKRTIPDSLQATGTCIYTLGSKVNRYFSKRRFRRVPYWVPRA